MIKSTVMDKRKSYYLMNKNYSKKEQDNFKNGKVMVVNSLNDIDEFIKKANYESTSNKKLYFGKVNSKTSLKIKKQTGIMINNYNLSLKANAVKHIFKRHSNEKEKISVTKQGKPILMFIKKLGEVYYLINSISDKNYSLEVITMWKKNKKKSATVDNV